jgi:hypothetical protein
VVSTTVKYMPENAPRNTETRISGSVSTSVRSPSVGLGDHADLVESGPVEHRVGTDRDEAEEHEEPDERERRRA